MTMFSGRFVAPTLDQYSSFAQIWLIAHEKIQDKNVSAKSFYCSHLDLEYSSPLLLLPFYSISPCMIHFPSRYENGMM
jgi:hypothetical protein